MMTRSRLILVIASTVTLTTLTAWMATGRHAYTKFVVVERVTTPIDPSDPLAQAGFYDDSTMTQTVKRSEFHLGFLPVPERLLDKHMLSVASIVGVVWLIALPMLVLARHCACCSSDPSPIQEYRS